MYQASNWKAYQKNNYFKNPKFAAPNLLEKYMQGREIAPQQEIHKKRWPQRPPFIIIFPTNHREENLLQEN